MPLTPEQRQRVLEAISAGRLPLDPPPKMYAGYGEGRTCNGCDEVVGPKEVEYEASYDGGRTYYLHLWCAGLWLAERRSPQMTMEEASEVRARSQAAREQAEKTAKQSIQLRDQADVLARESEAVIDKARRAKRGE
jgi:hypothetical protein